MIIFPILFSMSVASSGLAQPQATLNATGTGSSTPATFVSLIPNINDFGRMADGGSDGNWYVGFNNAWIVQLPPAPIGEYSRTFIGAKIGRAKARVKPGSRRWDREPIPGKVYIGISATPSFTAERSFFLAETSDIPLDSDSRYYAAGAGHSEWFWAEVPPGMISFSGPNYLIIWSPTSYFVDSSSSPILAAFENSGGAAEEEAHAWNNRSIDGVAPRRREGTLETPIRNLIPAMAIKLVPPNDSTVSVRDCAAKSVPGGVQFSFSTRGTDIDFAWLESSPDQLDWTRLSRYRRNPPYIITVPREKIPARGTYVRAVARDNFANEGSCDGIYIPHDGPVQ